jgi:hypothetical protein
MLGAAVIKTPCFCAQIENPRRIVAANKSPGPDINAGAGRNLSCSSAEQARIFLAMGMVTSAPPMLHRICGRANFLQRA